MILSLQSKRGNYDVESQNISPEVNFRKSKYITRSRLLEVKKHYRKLTSESQKINSILNILKND